MRAILHIFTRPPDAFVAEIIRRQSIQPQTDVAIVDLTQPEPDYPALLERIFSADSIETW